MTHIPRFGIADYLGAGVQRLLFHLDPGPADTVLRELDRLAELVERLR